MNLPRFRLSILMILLLGGVLPVLGSLLIPLLVPGRPWALAGFASLVLVALFLVVRHTFLIHQRTEKELYSVNETLEQRVIERSTAAEQRARQLAQANEELQHEITERRRIEESLEQERRLLHALMDHIPDSIYFKDRNGRFLRINRALAERFGLFDHTEAVGKTDFDFFSEEHARPAFLDEQEVMDTGQPLVGKEEKEAWSDGRERWVLTTKMPLRDPDGNVVGTFGLSRDITQRKQVEIAHRTSEERMRRLLDGAYDAFIAMDVNGRITEWNRQAEATFGWSRAEAVGQVLAETIIPPQYRVAHGRGLEQFLATGQGPVLNRRIEITALHRDGREFPVELTITPIRLGESFLFASFIHDITDRKQAEAEVLQAREAAEAASRAKSEFLAVMSHEIRTPMNGIIGMTELALDTPLSSEQREYLQMVKASADALLAVINDILDFSKIEARKLQLETIDFCLRDLLGDTMKALALRAEQKGLELALHVAPDVPDALLGDPGRLRQVIINLIGNAFKFTEQGEVVVDVQVADATSKGHLQFSVRDTGIGIPAEKQALIFEAFTQGDSSMTRKYGGTGLGLAISARLVEIMGGHIWVESQVGQGSTFHFTANFALATGPVARTPPARLLRLHGLAVLVVDDNATNRRILEEMLTNWDMRPEAVDGGASALVALGRAAAAGEPFPLVLLDAHMPEMDGFTLASRIQQRPEFARPTMLMLTSAGHPDDVARCRQLGITAYLMKPIKQSELLDSILSTLSNTWEPVVQPPGLGASPDGHVQRPLRILLAEDSPINQMLTVRLLEKQRHTVVVANNGREALELLGVATQQSGDNASATAAMSTSPSQGPGYDVVLMDVQMPDMDGLEATARIRQQEQATGQHVPIIAMTAHALKGDRERCLAAGMDAYVAKPVRADELFGAIAALIPGETPAAPTAAVPPNGEEVFNRAEALARAGGDVELLRELTRLLLELCPQRLTDLKAAIARQDNVALRTVSHAIKGELGAFGARAAFVAAQRLETVARQEDLAAAPQALAQLEDAVERLQPILVALLAESEGS